MFPNKIAFLTFLIINFYGNNIIGAQAIIPYGNNIIPYGNNIVGAQAIIPYGNNIVGTQAIIPIEFYDITEKQRLCDLIPIGRWNLLKYPKPSVFDDSDLYAKRCLYALNYNVKTLKKNSAKDCYIKRIGAEIFRTKYNMEVEKKNLIIPEIYEAQYTNDLAIYRLNSETGFFIYPMPTTAFILHENYQYKMIDILKQNIDIARNKGISEDLINRYKQRIICEIICITHDLLLEQERKSPECLVSMDEEAYQ